MWKKSMENCYWITHKINDQVQLSAYYIQINDELRKNASMLESENDKLTKNYTQQWKANNMWGIMPVLLTSV